MFLLSDFHHRPLNIPVSHYNFLALELTTHAFLQSISARVEWVYWLARFFVSLLFIMWNSDVKSHFLRTGRTPFDILCLSLTSLHVVMHVEENKSTEMTG